MELTEWITTQEAADLLGVTTTRVRQMIAEKQINAQKMGGKYRGQWQINTNDLKKLVHKKGVTKTMRVKNLMTSSPITALIDTNYNGEAFFVTHAYFLGEDKPYEKLKKALKADISESAWDDLYSTVSRPFAKPKTGKIAVKVINHYGDEVMKVVGV